MAKRSTKAGSGQAWLAKTEPDAFSIDDLQRDGTTSWGGVRNYQARNHLRAMKDGDPILIYHSSCKVPAIVGVGRVVGEPHPDPLQFDPTSDYHDPKSPRDNPRWTTVTVAFVAKFAKPIDRDQLRDHPEWSAHCLITGTRLSVMPVDPALAAATVRRGQG